MKFTEIEKEKMLRSLACSSIRRSGESIQSDVFNKFRDSNVSIINMFDLDTGLNFMRKIISDCRTFAEKKLEMRDHELEEYLLDESSKRRNAIYTECENSNMRILEFKMFAIREQYLRSFII